MLISIPELQKIDKFKDISKDELERKIKAIEVSIRSHTHNKFQNVLARFKGISKDNRMIGYNPYLRVGDTVEISQSVNNGLYVIKSIENDYITLDNDIFDFQHNLVTKIEYPADVVDGALKILEWDLKMQDKIGIQSESETLSRHSNSITYKTLNQDNTIEGRPAELFGFCRPYIKARF